MVLDEARKAVSRINGTRRGSRYIAAAERAFPYAMAVPQVGDFDCVELPDRDDRHVVAAALAGNCGVIVTYNTRDFPSEVLSPLGLRVLHPDCLLMEIAAADPDSAAASVRMLVAVKKRPPRTLEEELRGLRANRLNRFTDFVERALNLS